MIRPATTTLPLALAMLLVAAPATAASFDCRRASTPDEKTVCHYRALNDKDVKMATLYGLDVRLVPMGSRDAIRRDQSAWLKERRACGANAACLSASYDRRIAALQMVIDTRVYPQGPF